MKYNYEQKTISAIIFVFNEQNYISELIDSINNQTYKVDKIIICNDQSTDNTVEIIKDKQMELSENIEIVLLHNKKKGKVYAYEKALANVDTDLFFVCGGDDVIRKNYVKSMFEFIHTNNIQFAYSNQVWVDNNLNYLKYTKKESFYTLNNLFFANYAGGLIFGHSNIIGYYTPFPKGLSFEDWYVAMKLAEKFGKCYVNNDKNYLYRRHENASTFHSTIEHKITIIKRDIKFFALLVDMEFYPNVFKNRHSFYKGMISKLNFFEFLTLLFSKHLTIRERIKLMVIKLIRYYNV